ncbi:MAG: rhomboid family intramembrane serine protease [Pseudomonadota bacterium]
MQQTTRSGLPVQASQWRLVPVTTGLIACSMLGFLLVMYVSLPALVAWFTFVPFRISGNELQYGELGLQYWRLVTPVFLHFGWLHIVFNSLWLWDLGSRLELLLGRWNLLLLVIVMAVVSNVSQFLATGPSLFGGMSGVVFGLLGFSWVAPLLQPAWRIQPPPMVMALMVGWLLICLFGVIEVLGFGAIANGAHVGGLLSGAVLGAAFGFVSRLGGPGRPTAL